LASLRYGPVAAAAVGVVAVGPAAAADVAVSGTPVRRDARLQAEAHRRGRGHHHHRDSPVQEIPPHRGHGQAPVEHRIEHGQAPVEHRIEHGQAPGAIAIPIAMLAAVATSIATSIAMLIAMLIAMSMRGAIIITGITGRMPDATGCGIERQIT